MSLRLGAAAVSFSSSSAREFLIPIFAPNLISVLQQWLGIYTNEWQACCDVVTKSGLGRGEGSYEVIF